MFLVRIYESTDMSFLLDVFNPINPHAPNLVAAGERIAQSLLSYQE